MKCEHRMTTLEVVAAGDDGLPAGNAIRYDAEIIPYRPRQSAAAYERPEIHPDEIEEPLLPFDEW